MPLVSVSATGTFAGAGQKTAGYTLEMAYDNLHNVTGKKQHVRQNGIQFDGVLKAGYELAYHYAGNLFQISTLGDENYRTEGGGANDLTKKEHRYEYDTNGNLVYVNTAREKADGTQAEGVLERKLLWDEENRLEAIDDNGFVSNYWYDAAGERTVKTFGESEQIYVNSLFSGGNTGTADFTAYVNPYLVVSKGGQYTKHIYIGSQRIVSKLGDLDSYGAGVAGADIDYGNKYQASQQTIKDRYAKFGVPYFGKDNNDYVGGGAFGDRAASALARAMQRSLTENDNPELFQYYYHADHLGSSSLITDLDGETVQHIEYVPFGEVFIEERNNVWNTPYLFNAKELDEETGLYYYGARYYDPRTSVWLSTDPSQERYPNISTYAYAAQNPVKYIDPEGEKIVLAGTVAERKIILAHLQKLTNDQLSMKNDGTVIIVKMGGENSGKYLRAGSELIRDLNKKGDGAKTVTISIGASGNSASTADRNASGDLDWANATNGKGTNAIVNFDPTSNPSIPTIDPATRNVSGATRPNEIGLGHELIHADHINKGTVDFTTGINTYQTAIGPISEPVPKEEMNTIGLPGYNSNKVTENKLRKEQGLNERGAYYANED